MLPDAFYGRLFSGQTRMDAFYSAIGLIGHDKIKKLD
jgi:hypothetical protein